MALLTRTCIIKVIYTLCMWMLVSVVFLWLMNGSSSEFSEQLENGNRKYIFDKRVGFKGNENDRTDLSFEYNQYASVKNSNFQTLRKTKTMMYETNNDLSKINIGFVRIDIDNKSKTAKETVSNRHVGVEISSRKNDKSQRRKRLPQALIIGVKKCGTRALLEFLRIHPDVRAPGPEPHFFDRYFHLGWDWYREKMPPSIRGQLTIEKTPKYFVNPDVPRRVYNMSRDVKLIIVVRDPVTRAISDFTQAASKQLDTEHATLDRKAFRCNGTGPVNTHWSGINTGLYINHIRRWLEYFPFKSFHFVSGENLIKNPAQEIQSLQDFLNLTRFIKHEHFRFNETKGFPCVKKDVSGTDFQCFNSRKGRSHVYVPDDTISRLKAFFRPYNKEFYKLTGRNFRWS